MIVGIEFECVIEIEQCQIVTTHRSPRVAAIAIGDDHFWFELDRLRVIVARLFKLPLLVADVAAIVPSTGERLVEFQCLFVISQSLVGLTEFIEDIASAVIQISFVRLHVDRGVVVGESLVKVFIAEPRIATRRVRAAILRFAFERFVEVGNRLVQLAGVQVRESAIEEDQWIVLGQLQRAVVVFERVLQLAEFIPAVASIHHGGDVFRIEIDCPREVVNRFVVFLLSFPDQAAIVEQIRVVGSEVDGLLVIFKGLGPFLLIGKRSAAQQ